MKLGSILHRQVRVARVFGIPVRIDYRWFVVFALSTWLMSFTFTDTATGIGGVRLLDPSVAWVTAAVATLCLFLSIFGHELSHALVARLEGIETEEIVLHPFGGLARLRSEPDTPRAEFRIAAAGPAASFVIGALAFGVMNLLPWGRGPVWATFLIIFVGNIMLAVFNLLPGYPLDGGRVLRAILWHRSGELKQATKRVSQFGQLIAAVVIIYGLWMAFEYGAYFIGLWSGLVGLFLWDAARAVYRAHAGGGLTTVAEAMSAPLALEPDTLVSRLVDDILPARRQTAFAVARGGRLHGILTLEDLKRLPRERWHATRVSEVMRPVAPQLFVAPETPLSRADELMRANGAGAVGVIDDAGRLVGFLQRGRIKRRSNARQPPA
jgi:Zn-dependent protease